MSTHVADLRSAGIGARPRAPAWLDVVAAGLVVGALDLLACSLYWAAHGVPPARIARSLGELVIGADAYAPGAGGVIAGLLVEAALGVGLVAACLGVLATRPRLRERPLRNGVAFGALAFAAFEWILVPLSAAAPRMPSPEWQIVLLAIYAFVLGIPAALLAGRIAVSAPNPAP